MNERQQKNKECNYKKSLILCFSRADENYAVGWIEKGNTEIIAEYIQHLTGADLFKVEPLVPYAADYRTCIEQAKQRVGHAPIKSKPTDISTYDIIYILSPIYWGTFAPEMGTVLEGLDFSGKTIRILSTHEGSSLGSMVSDVMKKCKGAKVDAKGLAIRGSQAKSSQKTVEKWLKQA